MVLAALAYEKEDDEEKKEKLLDEILYYNEQDFDIVKEMFFDINPVTETGVGSCMFPYHELKRIIHNMRHPEDKDEEVISSGVEAFGWLWLQKGDIVQLNLSAKIDGYSAAIGYPIVLGKLEGKRRDVVMFGLEAHKWTQQQVKSGVPASQIAENFYKYYVENGYKDNFVYGPLHGTGMIEVEAPWVETTSDYALKPNMTFQIDTFISTDTFGVRWEKGIAVTEDGCDVLSPEIGKLYELEF